MVDRAISSVASKPATENSQIQSGLSRVSGVKSLSDDEVPNMGRPYGSRDKLLELMSDGKPRSSRQVAEQLHFTDRAAESVCYRCWKAGLLLRAANPIRERNRTFAGRAGSRYNTRSYYLFILQNGSVETEAENLRFLSFAKTPRIANPNKSQLILSFLRKNVGKAFYTSEIAKLLKNQGITIRDIAPNLRLQESQRKVNWWTSLSFVQILS
jgi:hypothetical protein